jgi:phosphohistidine phosphatase
VRRVYLLRHAKSSWDDPALSDHDRPLAPRGRRAAASLARYLKKERIRPELVLCSSSVRTQQTLDGIRPALGKKARVEIEDGLYAASEAVLLERLRSTAGEVESVLVIAHNPGTQDLAVSLVGRGEGLGRLHEKFPTGALAALAFSGPWADLAPATCELERYVLPRELA